MTTTSSTEGPSPSSMPSPSMSPSSTSPGSSGAPDSATSEKKVKQGSQEKMGNVPVDVSQDASVDSTKETKNTDEVLKYQRSAIRTQTMTVKNNTQQAALDNVSEKQPSLDAYSGDAKPLPLSDESVNLIAEFQFGPQNKTAVSGMDFLPGEDIDPSMYSDFDASNPSSDLSVTPDVTPTSSGDQPPTVSPNKYTSTLGSFMVATSKSLLEMISGNTAFKTAASKIQAGNMQMSFSQATLSKNMSLSAAKLTMTSKMIGGFATFAAGGISVGGGLASYYRNDLTKEAKAEKQGITDAQGQAKTAEQTLEANKTNIPLKEQEIDNLKAAKATTGDEGLKALGAKTKADAEAARPGKETELAAKEALLTQKTTEFNNSPAGSKQKEELKTEVDNITKERDSLQTEVNGLKETIGKSDLEAGKKAKADATAKLPAEEAKLKSMKDNAPKLETDVKEKEKAYSDSVSNRANRVGSYDNKMTMFTKGLGEMITGLSNVVASGVELGAAQTNAMADYAKSVKSIDDTMSQTMAKSIQTSEDNISGVFQTMMAVTKTKNVQ